MLINNRVRGKSRNFTKKIIPEQLLFSKSIKEKVSKIDISKVQTL